ncbi:MAG: cell division protein FtsB [Rickettsiales bacterium]
MVLKKFPITKQIFVTICVATAVMLYFIYYAFFGSHGVIKYFSLKNELQNKELIKESLVNKVQDKQNLVNGMNSKSLDLDLLDEESRKNLGYSGKKEIVIYENINIAPNNKK